MISENQQKLVFMSICSVHSMWVVSFACHACSGLDVCSFFKINPSHLMTVSISLSSHCCCCNKHHTILFIVIVFSAFMLQSYELSLWYWVSKLGSWLYKYSLSVLYFSLFLQLRVIIWIKLYDHSLHLHYSCAVLVSCFVCFVCVVYLA